MRYRRLDGTKSNAGRIARFRQQQPHVYADALMAALDGINRSGKGKVWFAGQGARDSSWQMKRERLSPRYTTRLKDIPAIN